MPNNNENQINEVVLNGETLLTTRGDTVSEDNLLLQESATDRAGVKIKGELDPYVVSDPVGTVEDGDYIPFNDASDTEKPKKKTLLSSFVEKLKGTFLPKSWGHVTLNTTNNPETLSIVDNQVDATKTNNDVSSNHYPTTANIRDKNNKTITNFETVVKSDGTISAALYAQNFDTNGTSLGTNTIRATIDKSGKRSYSVTDPNNFREAIKTIDRMGTEIPANSDLDTYRTAGTYHISTNEIAATISNMPFDIGWSGKLVVMYMGGGSSRRVDQVYITNPQTKNYVYLYLRGINNDGVATPWIELGKRFEELDIKNALEIKNVDINTYMTVGMYYWSSANASTITNRPTNLGDAALFYVLKTWDGDSYIKQVVLARSVDRLFIRTTSNGGSSWSEWKEISTSSNGVTWEQNNILGAKNLFNFDDAYPVTNSGLTLIRNEDKSLTIKAGTTTNEFYFPTHPVSITSNTHIAYNLEPNTSYIFSVGTSNSALRLQCYYKAVGSSSWTVLVNQVNVNAIVFTTPSAWDGIWVRTQINPSTTLSSDITIYPMIRLSSIKNDTFEPFAIRNQDLPNKLIVNSGKEIVANSDLNDYVEEGVYQCELGATARTISNMPYTDTFNTAFKLIVMKLRHSNNKVQYYIPYWHDNNSLVSYRFTDNNGTSWTQWLSTVKAYAETSNSRPLLTLVASVSSNKRALLRYNQVENHLIQNFHDGTNWGAEKTLANLDDISPSGVGLGYAQATVSGSTITATITGFKLSAGVIVSLLISNEISTACTLNINSTGAKSVKFWGDENPTFGKYIGGGNIVTFIYDGTYYRVISQDRTPKILAQDYVADTSGNILIDWGYGSNRAQLKYNVGANKLCWNYYKNTSWRGDLHIADYDDLVHQTLGVTIADNSDLNTFRTNGIFNVSTNTKAQTISNTPVNVAGKLIVMPISGLRYINQFYITYSNGATNGGIYWRAYNGDNSTWSSWTSLTSGGTSYDVITAYQISVGTDTESKVVRADYLKAGIRSIMGAIDVRLNSLRLKQIAIPDNSGYPKYLLLKDVTTWFNSTTTGQSTQGFNGLVFSHRESGNMYNYTCEFKALVSYKKTTTPDTRGGQGQGNLILEANHTCHRAVIMKDANNKYYLAMRCQGSGRHAILFGVWVHDSNYNTDWTGYDGTWVNCTDSNGTLPTGYSIAIDGRNNSSPIKDISRTGSYTFTATRSDDTTFTFAQTFGTFYGTCTTAANEKDKVATVDNNEFELRAGTIVGVKFTNSNSYSATADNKVTLNVNSTGAKPIWYGTGYPTGTHNTALGSSNRIHYYMYDGSNWVWVSHSQDNDSVILPSAYCTTAAGTAAKTASCTNYNLATTSYLHILFQNSNTAASALTLNVNGKGAKPIYINGSASSSTNYSLPAGTYIAYYNGTNYNIRTDGQMQSRSNIRFVDTGSLYINDSYTSGASGYYGLQIFANDAKSDRSQFKVFSDGLLTFNYDINGTWKGDGQVFNKWFPNVAYCTSSTAAGTAAKVASTQGGGKLKLLTGVVACVVHSNTNTASNCTLNIDDTGAKQIYYNQSVYTGTSDIVCGRQNLGIFYMYDGTYWRWMGMSRNDNSTNFLRNDQSTTLTASGGPAIQIKSTTFDLKQANNGVSETTYAGYSVRDKNDYTMTRFETVVETSGVVQAYMQVRNRKSDNTEAIGGLRIKVDKAGTFYYQIDAQRNFNAELGFGYGTCSTAGSEQTKVVSCANFKLIVGGIIGVKFSNSNTYSATTDNKVMLNVNGTGAKPIYYWQGYPTGTQTTAFGVANRIHYYMYDGTNWVFMGQSGEANDNQRRSFFGNCTTAADQQVKVVTLVNSSGWELTAGTMVSVKFSNTNSFSSQTATPVQLNVNNTGAKNIWYNNTHSGAGNTGTNTRIYGEASRVYTYVYDGTYWVWESCGYEADTVDPRVLGSGYGTCTTAAATTAKVVTMSNYSLRTGGVLSVQFSNDVPANATMNINSRGAKSICYRGAAIKDGVILGGDRALFVFNGSQYDLLSVDRESFVKSHQSSATGVPKGYTTYNSAMFDGMTVSIAGDVVVVSFIVGFTSAKTVSTSLKILSGLPKPLEAVNFLASTSTTSTNKTQVLSINTSGEIYLLKGTYAAGDIYNAFLTYIKQ